MNGMRSVLGRKRQQLNLLRHCRCISTHDVVIVGGGPCGLMLSNLLSARNIPSVLIDAQSPRFHHPQAHFLNTRTMEILYTSLPNVYQKIKHAMPPVEQWRYMQFGYSASSGIMARVVHPVDVPLAHGNDDSNGILLPIEQMSAPPTRPPLYPASHVTVGHLAQHTLTQIFYEEALANHYTAQLFYDTKVTNVQLQPDNYSIVTTATPGLEFRAKVVVGADGSNSLLRRLWNIGWKGQDSIQHLVNIHFTTSSHVAAKLPPAMLYSIFSPSLVGMMVCHSPGEYVLQVPYFPPYQTLERDFTINKVMHIIAAALGFSDSSIHIQSIKSWNMSSMIASSFTSGPGGVLMGDAAHVFPPAGGFGLNTGIQDAHALAWRLAQGMNGRSITRLLQEYSLERNNIAQDNAALSVRNYQRILNLTKACYLNDQHPQIVIQMLNGLSSILSLEQRQNLFQTLIQIAMWPLSQLMDRTSIHGKHVTTNIRSILQQGGGLPLLFPKLELGFGYSSNGNQTTNGNVHDDTQNLIPVLQQGYRLPHVSFRVIRGNAIFPAVDSMMYSSELPEQWLILAVGKWQSRIPIRSIPVIRILAMHETDYDDSMDVVLQECSSLSSFFEDLEPALIVLRPDGHIAKIIANNVAEDVELELRACFETFLDEV